MDLLQNYLSETWLLIAEMGPYLLLGFLVAGALHRWIREGWIQSKLGKPGLKSIVLASLVGVPMPLCSCGVIPVTASLRDKGASRGAAASFLTSTPQTGVDSILATYGMLGPVFALYRVIVALISGFAVGTLIDRFGVQDDAPTSAKSIPSDSKPTWTESLRYGILTMPADIAASLTIGFLLAGLISALSPDNLLANLPGGVYASILLTTAIAIPFYICSTGSIPLALALIASGLPVSAALVLLIAGPATNIATIATMRKTLGGRETTIYVGSVIVTSWIAALLFHQFLDTGAFAGQHLHEMETGLWKHTSGVALVGILVFAYWSANRPSSAVASNESISPDPNSENATLSIKGMTCSHCQASALDGLKSLPFAQHVDVDLKSGQAHINGPTLDRDTIARKLDSLGFTLSDFSLQSNEPSQ
ncbi:MAG: hypothetical protein HOI15_06815 [Opitutales bacterium]|jgi:uncharacterized protein|nr:hypothetical protein [Opitutales bacterium]